MNLGPLEKKSNTKSTSAVKKTDGPSKKPTDGKSRAKHIAKKVGKVLLILVLSGIILASIGMTILIVYVNANTNTGGVDLRKLKLGYTSIIYGVDSSTGENVEVQRLFGSENRVWINYQDIPKYAIDALISAEDERFMEHQGVDWKRTIGSFVNIIIPIYDSRSGGSTITQQLIKNVTNDKSLEIERKVREIVRALALEKQFTKEEILEAYLNTMPVSNNTAGLKAASYLYFSKDVSELSLAEITSIIAVTKSPTALNPLKNPEANKSRQMYILGKMLSLGKISQQEYDEAANQPLEFKTTTLEITQQIPNWFVDQVFEDVSADLQEKYGYTTAEAENIILNSGCEIYTTMDIRIQNLLEAAYKDENSFLKLGTGEQPQSAMVIMDYNGNCVAMVGGRGEKTGMRLLNRAKVPRNPGSSIKPISVYAPAIQNDTIYWSQKIDNQPITLSDGTKWPKNFDGTYGNPVTIVSGISQSLNTVAVRVGQMNTTGTMYNFLKDRLHISTLVSARTLDNGTVTSDNALAPLCVGSMTDGVTVYEMTAAFQIFGNGGLYHSPRTYTKVIDNTGTVILDKQSTTERVLSEDSAMIMNLLLQQVVTGPEGTAGAAKIPGVTVAGKTGRDDDNKYLWFMGLTPKYVAGIYVGHDTPKALPQTRHPAIYTWQKIMAKVMAGTDAGAFPESSGVVAAEYCTESGQLATSACPNKLTGYYKKSNMPGFCTLHSSGETSSSSGDGTQQ